MSVERRAFLLAAKAHEHQRYGQHPYLVHLFDVVAVLRRFDHDVPVMLASAWLHDVIEDTALNYHDVIKATNESVAETVLALTDEIGRNRKERKARTLPKLRGDMIAQTVKLADWIANVEDARTDTPRLLQMYRKDYPEFSRVCRGDFDGLEPMWQFLDTLLEADSGKVI